MKKLKFILFCILVYVLLSPLNASAWTAYVDGFEASPEVKTDGVWYYSLDHEEKSAIIYGYKGEDTDVVIPDTLEDEYAVTELWLLQDMIYDENSSSTGSFPIYNIKNCKIETITLPKTLKKIKSDRQSPRYDYDLLNDIVKYKGEVIVEGALHLDKMPEFKAFYVDSDNKYFTSDNGILYSKDKSTLILYPLSDKNTAKKTYKVPKTVNFIMDDALRNGHNISELTITENVDRIGEMAVGTAPWYTSAKRYTQNSKLIILNNKLDENDFRIRHGAKYFDYYTSPWEITVYEDSPAFKHFKGRENIVVIDNPYIEKEEKTEKTSSSSKKSSSSSSKASKTEPKKNKNTTSSKSNASKTNTEKKQPQISNTPVSGVASAEITMNINKSGKMTITYKYAGFPTITVKAVVTTFIDNKFLSIFWKRLELGTPNNEWVETIYDYRYTDTRNYQLNKSGTYRVSVNYKLYSADGTVSEINCQAKDSY